MPRTKTIMLDIKRGGIMRIDGTVSSTDTWIPGRVAEIGTSGEIQAPTTDTYVKGFIVEGKKSGDSQTKVALIIDPVVFTPFTGSADDFGSGASYNSIASGITFSHGEAIYIQGTTGALTNTGDGAKVGSFLAGYYDANASTVYGNIKNMS